MEVNVDPGVMDFMIQDMRQSPEKDAMYTTAVELAEEIMQGIGRLERSGTVETATLYITQTGANSISLLVHMMTYPWIECLLVH